MHSERQASTNTGALVLKENEDHLGDLGNGGLCGGGGVGAGRGMWGSPAGKKCENWTNLGKVSSTSITDGFRKKVFDTLPFREVVKKNGLFMVRLTVRVDPPPYGQPDRKKTVF